MVRRTWRSGLAGAPFLAACLALPLWLGAEKKILRGLQLPLFCDRWLRCMHPLAPSHALVRAAPPPTRAVAAMHRQQADCGGGAARSGLGGRLALWLAQWPASLLCCAWTQMRLGTQLLNLLAEGGLPPLNLVALSIKGVLSLLSIQIRRVSRLGRTLMCPNQSDAYQIHCSAHN